jgi:putative ABC transport system substrate-binding protein
MQRREFITLIGSAAAAWPLTAQGQGANPTRYVAWLGLGHAGTPSPYLDSLRTGLRELGWIEGRNLKIVAFWATGREDMEGVAREVLTSGS